MPVPPVRYLQPNKKYILEGKLDKSVLTVSLLDELSRELWRNVVDLEEKVVREALIKLGWTPPRG